MPRSSTGIEQCIDLRTTNAAVAWKAEGSLSPLLHVTLYYITKLQCNTNSAMKQRYPSGPLISGFAKGPFYGTVGGFYHTETTFFQDIDEQPSSG